MTKYTVRYERDEDKWWIARIPEVPGVLTQGRSIKEARTRVREALEAAIGAQARVATLVDDIDIPSSLKNFIAKLKEAQKRAEKEQRHAAELARKVAHDLVKRKKLSVRDAGEVMGISGARVQQLVND